MGAWSDGERFASVTSTGLPSRINNSFLKEAQGGRQGTTTTPRPRAPAPPRGLVPAGAGCDPSHCVLYRRVHAGRWRGTRLTAAVIKKQCSRQDFEHV